MVNHTTSSTATTKVMEAAEKLRLEEDEEMQRMITAMEAQQAQRKADKEACAQEQEQQVEEESKATDQPTTEVADTAELDLVDRMRRLSAGSELSDFSIISGAPSVQSLDTDGSAKGGVIVASQDVQNVEQVAPTPSENFQAVEQLAPATAEDILPSQGYQTPEQALQALAYRPAAVQSPLRPVSPAPVPETQDLKLPRLGFLSLRPMSPISVMEAATFLPAKTPLFVNLSDAHIASYRPSPAAADPSAPLVSHFWLQFPEFVPVPTASFKSEFARLAKGHSWNVKTRRQRQIEALKAEFDFHYGTCMTNLDHWQQLCKDVDAEKNLTSITQCKKASTK